MFIFIIRMLLIILFTLYVIWGVREIIKSFKRDEFYKPHRKPKPTRDEFHKPHRKPKSTRDEFSEAYKLMNECIEVGIDPPQHIKDIVNHRWK